jgi:hypothetical protein
MAANPDVFGWRAEDEHYADEDFGDPNQQIVCGGNLPLNRVSLAWCDPAVASAPSWPQSANSACLTKRNQRTGLGAVQDDYACRRRARVCRPSKLTDTSVRRL